MIDRSSDWPERLDEVIRNAKAKPFKWGEHDCCIFVSDCIEAMTGESFGKETRGKYSTAAGALKILKKTEGVDGVYELAEKYLKPSVRVRRGDVVGFNNDGDCLLGVAVAGKAVFLTPIEGIVVFKLESCEKVWRV